jgi:CO/xanthine dehydrogenase Mo-binding subunit
MKNTAIDKVLDRIEERMNWNAPFDRGSGRLRRGRGVAIGLKASISPTTSGAIVNVAADGSIVLYTNTIDMGQGSDTAMAQIAAEVLNVATESVKVVHGNTDVAPYDMGTLGSRSTFHMGNAVRRAAEDARDRLAALATEAGLPAGTNYDMRELFRKRYGMQAGNVIGTGIFVPPYTPPDPATGQSPDVTPFWMVGGTGAEVEVDTETGQLRVIRLVNVVDAGKPVNPKICKTQISGGAIMQLGFTLYEDMVFDGGQVTNASFADYKIPGFRDIPAMESDTVNSAQESGPFGAKGVGESSTFAVSPAIANAIHDAVGVRLMDLPIRAEDLLRAIRAAEGRPMGDDE